LFLFLLLYGFILFFYTAAPADDTFTDLNPPNNTNNSLAIEDSFFAAPTIDVGFGDDKKIVQLTTAQVVGFQEVSRTNSSTNNLGELYYIESGTGHIFSINLESGEERRVTATTIPSSRKGVITQNGLYTLIQSGSGAGSQFTVGRISTTSASLSTHQINDPIIDFATTENNTFIYLSSVSGGLVGKEYNPVDRSTNTLFGIPFNEARVVWGQTATSSHYVYPKPNDQLEGYLYKAENGTLERLPVSGLGLSVIGNGEHVLFTSRTKDDYRSDLYNELTGETANSFVTVLPDKCVSMRQGGSFLCASEEITFNYKTFENWYEGSLSYDDDLWEIFAPFGDISFSVDVTRETGRELDIINLQTNPSNTSVYFQNKNDQTLWWYKVVNLEN